MAQKIECNDLGRLLKASRSKRDGGAPTSDAGGLGGKEGRTDFIGGLRRIKWAARQEAEYLCSA